MSGKNYGNISMLSTCHDGLDLTRAAELASYDLKLVTA
jgi:hypothetical protein